MSERRATGFVTRLAAQARVAKHVRASAEDGFTLLEVIVALTILGVSLAILFGIFSQAVARNKANADAGAARALAESVLQRTLAGGETAQSGTTESGLSWQIRTAPYGSAEDQQSWTHGLSRVTVTVFWPGVQTQNRISLSTLRLEAKRPAS